MSSGNISDLFLRLVANQPKLSELSEEVGQRLAYLRLSEIQNELIERTLTDKQLISNKDKQNYVEYVEGGILLHLLSFIGNDDSVEWLLKHNAYPHSSNPSGNTPLHAAVSNNQVNIIRTLRYYHADVYSINKNNKTAVNVAQERDDDEAKEVLLSNRFSSEEAETEFLQERLPQLVEKVMDSKTDEAEREHCLLSLRAEIRSATSSMTSVPKPLKMLQEHYEQLKQTFDAMDVSQHYNRQLLSDILSVLSMTVDDNNRMCLSYRLSGTNEDIASFGHPYIRRICTQIPQEWNSVDESQVTLLPLVLSIVQYCLKHNAEAEACDLLMEIDSIMQIVGYVSEETHERVCLYLTSCVNYVPEPEDTMLLRTALAIYQKYDKYTHTLRLAMMLNDLPLLKDILLTCPDKAIQKQLAFMLGRQQIVFDLSDTDQDDSDELVEIMANVHLNNNYLNLARELDIMDPKTPEDIYKTHLEHSRFSTAQPVDSARANLAGSFVNGFVNCGFGVDKLLTDEGTNWIYKHKSHGMLSATASLGLILLWDVEGGLTQIDKFLYSNEDYIKSGALLACGIVNCGVRNECDPALALLTDYVEHESSTMRLGAIIGLGLAYAGSQRDNVIEILTPVLWNSKSTFEDISLAALSCSMIAVGSCHGELVDSILQLIMERIEPDRIGELTSTHGRYLALALALLYLGKQEAAEVSVETLKAVPEPFSSFATVLLEICAYAGTGNVLKIQSLLHICSEYFGDDEKEGEEKEEKKKEKSKEGKSKRGEDKKEKRSEVDSGSISEPGSHQSISVLGIALIAMGEDIGSEMALRTFNHLLRYGESVIRRAVPLALALISASNPELNILDTLSKFSHDSDPTVARNAIFAMGIVGAGTNNARLAGLLRNLAQYYHKEPLDLFMVRLAQGLTHLGKGTLTLNPFHSDKALMTPVSIAGLMTVMVAMLCSSNTILSNAHYMIYYLTPAIQPRMLVTFDESLSPLNVTVRVGQAVDVVGQAGKPKSITGFQTHTTPVLLAHGERAELATEEYIPLTPIVEGFVILRKNPEYSED